MSQTLEEQIFSTGKIPVGYLCTATPQEIIDAAGGFAFRLTGTGENLECAEALAHPNLCGFCKSALAWVKDLSPGRKLFAVCAASCDGCRRLCPLLATLDSVQAAFSFDLPRMADDRSIDYYATELKNLHERLAASLGTEADPDLLRESIKRYQNIRAQFRRVLDAVYQGRLPIATAFETADAFFHSTPDRFARFAQDALAKASDQPSRGKGEKVIIAGNITNDGSLAGALTDAGARLVGLDLCNVDRAAMIEVGDEDDPYLALARAIFKRPLCPRFEPAKDWTQRIRDQAQQTGARAVILFSLKFCDNTLFAFPQTKQHLESLGLSVLTLEGDFEKGISGQMATRIEAFLEML